MFCTIDNQIFPKEAFPRNASYRQLIAIKIPFYFFVTRVISLFLINFLNNNYNTFIQQDNQSELDRYTMKANATLQSSKTDLLDGNDENMSMKYSRIRIQLPKLDTIDTSGLISRTNKHDLHSNGFLSDSEVGGKRKQK